MESGVVSSGGLRVLLGIVGAAAAIVGAFLGAPLVWTLSLLIGLMLLDVLTALVANRGDWDPEAGRLGWRRKTNTVLLVLSVALVQGALERGVQVDLHQIPTAAAVAGPSILFELGSIIRNSKKAGVKWIPDGLVDLFRVEAPPPVPDPLLHGGSH